MADFIALSETMLSEKNEMHFRQKQCKIMNTDAKLSFAPLPIQKKMSKKLENVKKRDLSKKLI